MVEQMQRFGYIAPQVYRVWKRTGKRLSTHHYIDVLRYWVAAIRHEESLTVRPKAIRQTGPDAFNWKAPIGNHTYFKTARDDAVSAFILGEREEVECQIHGEQRSFLGRQVRQVYYRQDHAWQVDENVRANVVFGFPALYMPRSDELATLIRCRASIAWLDDTSNAVSYTHLTLPTTPYV